MLRVTMQRARPGSRSVEGAGRRAGGPPWDLPRAVPWLRPGRVPTAQALASTLRTGPGPGPPGSALTLPAGIPIIWVGISPKTQSEPAAMPSGDPMTTTRELVSDRRDEFAFHDDIVYLAETKRGLTRETVEEISALQGRARLDAPVPAARLRALPDAADADLGRRPRSTSTSTRSSTTASRPSAKRSPGTTSRRRSRRRSSGSASPRRSASSWPASAPSTTPRSSTTRSARS